MALDSCDPLALVPMLEKGQVEAVKGRGTRGPEQLP